MALWHRASQTSFRCVCISVQAFLDLRASAFQLSSSLISDSECSNAWARSQSTRSWRNWDHYSIPVRRIFNLVRVFRTLHCTDLGDTHEILRHLHPCCYVLREDKANLDPCDYLCWDSFSLWVKSVALWPTDWKNGWRFGTRLCGCLNAKAEEYIVATSASRYLDLIFVSIFPKRVAVSPGLRANGSSKWVSVLTGSNGPKIYCHDRLSKFNNPKKFHTSIESTAASRSLLDSATCPAVSIFDRMAEIIWTSPSSQRGNRMFWIQIWITKRVLSSGTMWE